MGPRCSSAETQVCHRSYIIAATALITNILLTSWGNEMKFTEKIEKELIYSNNQNL